MLHRLWPPFLLQISATPLHSPIGSLRPRAQAVFCATPGQNAVIPDNHMFSRNVDRQVRPRQFVFESPVWSICVACRALRPITQQAPVPSRPIRLQIVFKAVTGKYKRTRYTKPVWATLGVLERRITPDQGSNGVFIMTSRGKAQHRHAGYVPISPERAPQGAALFHHGDRTATAVSVLGVRLLSTLGLWVR